jgi:cytochrome c oxidase assembly protein subunit 15
VSTAHAGLAEIFFCMTVAIALFTSPRWIEGYGHDANSEDDRVLRRVATTTTGLIYVQILVGAAMRHSGAGLAIPDFPLMFGHLWPTHWDPKIAIHFTHRVGAIVVALAIVATSTSISSAVWSRHRRRPELTRPASLLVALVVVQITLGALTVLSHRDIWINSLHVVCGALVLTTSLVLTLRTWRTKFATAAVRQVRFQGDVVHRKPDPTADAADVAAAANVADVADVAHRAHRAHRGARA